MCLLLKLDQFLIRVKLVHSNLHKLILELHCLNLVRSQSLSVFVLRRGWLLLGLDHLNLSLLIDSVR